MAQILLNVAYSALIFTLLGISFDIVYRTTSFFHFAHASVMLCAAYFTLVVFRISGQLWIGAVVGIGVATATNVGMEAFIFSKLREKGASSLSLLLVSLGLFIVAQNLISLSLGDGTQILWSASAPESLLFHGVYITPIQMITMISSVILILLMQVALRYSKTGKSIRAVTADQELAESTGLEVKKIRIAAFAISAALGSVAMLFAGMDSGINPGLGLRLLLISVVVMIVGGVGSLPGAAIAGLILAAAQNAAVWWISSAWQDAITFAILASFLIFRPQGIMGRKAREESI